MIGKVAAVTKPTRRKRPRLPNWFPHVLTSTAKPPTLTKSTLWKSTGSRDVHALTLRAGVSILGRVRPHGKNGQMENSSPDFSHPRRERNITRSNSMRALVIALLAAATLTACTTAEKTASGAGVGAAIGAVATGSAGGAVAGAVIGGLGTYLVEVGDGNCQYRNSRGQIYTRRCHWL